MTEQSSLLMLLLMVFGLGVRHGLDLDHIATIDAISRTVKSNERLSKKVGLLFSLGHGMVIILLSLIIGCGFLKDYTPYWLEGFGTWISIFFLLLFGLISLWSSLYHSEKETLHLSIKSYLLRFYNKKEFNAVGILLIGALFALSFDTFTQVALFSISATYWSGWLVTLSLGFLFMLGMMTSDGLNGLLIASIIQRADQRSHKISTVLGVCIGVFSLYLGIMTMLAEL